jgi:phage baseplate assembly protein W
MPITFTVEPDALGTPTVTDELAIDGEDIKIPMIESQSGDLTMVSGVDAARQSVLRELPANPGSFPRRPTWGGGMSGLILKGATGATRDQMQARARARLLANPRITKVHECAASVNGIDGVLLNIRCDALGGFVDESPIFKPPGVP